MQVLGNLVTSTVTCVGKILVMMTWLAASGPALFTLTVYVKAVPTFKIVAEA